MPSINRVTLLGHLGRDPETKYTQGGKTVCNGSIATVKSWKQEDEWKKKTTWHKIVAWGKAAEALGLGTKGSLVFVEGELTQRSWENKEGVKQYVTEVLAAVVVVIGKLQTAPMETDHGEIPSGSGDDVPF
jgi:single-strand DNA-binding protein